MQDIEPRVSVLEKRMTDHQERFGDIAQALRQFEGRVAGRFTSVDGRFAQIDARFIQIDARFMQIDARFLQVDARFAQIDSRFAQVDERLTALNAELIALRRDMTTQFRWTAGLMLTGFVAIAAAILAQ